MIFIVFKKKISNKGKNIAHKLECNSFFCYSMFIELSGVNT